MKKMKSSRVAMLGVLSALAMALSFMEMLLPPLPLLPAGFKIGLSNIVVMYALFIGGAPYGLVLAAVKSVFILFINGGYAFVLSLCGSLSAVLVMWIILKIFKKKASYIALSVSGALVHNAAQLLMVCVLTASTAPVYYAPLLVIAAVVCGSLTALIIRLLMPVLNKTEQKFI